MSRARNSATCTPARRHALAMLGLWLARPTLAQPAAPAAEVLKVGPTRALRTLAQAAAAATDGTRVEVDAGEYRADVAFWPQNALQLRAVGGRVRLVADGAAAQGKGIFVTRGTGVRVEGFDFEGARVPSLNGAGIRVDAGTLQVVDCTFTDNETGILTGNDGAITLTLERCEFARQRRADGRNHHVYAGSIGRLEVTGCHFHGAESGHLLKSRAREHLVAYNRLADGAQGRASYELEFPNGGRAVVVGNVIQQGPQTENAQIVSFGAEGLQPGPNELHMAYNTLVDTRDPPGVFVNVRPGTDRVRLINNLLVGRGAAPAESPDVRNNPVLALADLVDAAGGDYRVRRSAAAALRAAPLGAEDAVLLPRHMFVAPRVLADRPRASLVLPGALPAQA